MYPKLIHLTCVAHAIHRVAESIRDTFPDIDKLIAEGKKVFLKAPKRIQILKEMEPDLPLPPKPVVTRWGTWLEASSYYAQHLQQFGRVIVALDSNDAVAIRNIQKLINEECVKNGLAYIAANFASIPCAIKKLEGRLPLVESVTILSELESSIVDAAAATKLQAVLTGNEGLSELRKVAQILAGQKEIESHLGAMDIASLKYAPIVSCDVERSFSMYKDLLAEADIV
jgi:uncharacterized protein (UPF0147 family)